VLTEKVKKREYAKTVLNITFNWHGHTAVLIIQQQTIYMGLKLA